MSNSETKQESIGSVQPPRVRMGEAVRLRLEGWMRAPIRKHASMLAAAAKHPVSQAGAIRELIARSLRGCEPDVGYLAGYSQGFLAGYAEGKRRIAAAESEGKRGDIRPQPSDENGDYRGEVDGEGGPES